MIVERVPEIVDVANFFEKDCVRSNIVENYKEIDSDIVNIIRNTINKNNNKFLDVGGGNGSFASLLLDIFPDLDVSVIDPSKKNINSISDPRIRTLLGRIPDRLNIENAFDYISCNYVFHHIVGNSIYDSKKLISESLDILKSNLNKPGYLFISEMYYESYIYNGFSRDIIFIMCKIQNKSQSKLPLKGFQRGLLVCFYTREELKFLLEERGFKIVSSKETPMNKPITFRMAGLKNFGRMVICAKLE